MATTSTNLSLRKPDSSDTVSVALDISANLQTLDDKWASSAAADIGAAAAAGSALTVARADHVHRVASGTAAAPGLPVGEANTGLYRIGTGQLGVSILGTLIATVKAIGVVCEAAFTGKQIATPAAAPAAGYLDLYAKTDANWYKRTPAGAETLMLDTVGHAALTQRRNRAINGTMAVWQRGPTAPTTTDNAYGPDRWRVVGETTTTGFTINRESSDVPAGGARYAAKLAVGASNNTKNGLFTPLEGVDIWDLRGQTVSLQVALKVSDPRIGDVRMALVQWTGAEDAVSADPINVWGAAGTNPTYTGSWANVNTPASLSPTTSWATYKLEAQTISASATNLAVFVWIDDKTTTAGDYLLLTDVQLERGALCTVIERRPFVEDLLACQRYFCKTFPYGTTPAQNAGTGGALHFWSIAAATGSGVFWHFPVAMRATPTTTGYNPSAANALLRNATDAADSNAISFTQVSDHGAMVYAVMTATDGAGDQLVGHATAVAEL